MKLIIVVSLIINCLGYASAPSAASKPPQLWSHHKQMEISPEACSTRGHKVLKVLGFSSVVKKDNYVYGNYLDNRAAVKCAPLDKGSFLYLAVAGSDKNIVEKLRNELSKKMASSAEIKELNPFAIEKFIPFSVEELTMFDKGFQLFMSGKFARKFNDGFYIDPNKQSQVLDFWSNGKWAKYDRHSDGHYETLFEIISSRLIYVGSIGKKGTFIDVGKGYKRFLNKSVTEWREYLKERAKKTNRALRAREV